MNYAVLRPDLETCLARLTERLARAPDPPEELARQHARFRAFGRYEANVFDASGTPEEVAAAVLAAFGAGQLAEASSAA